MLAPAVTTPAASIACRDGLPRRRTRRLRRLCHCCRLLPTPLIPAILMVLTAFAFALFRPTRPGTGRTAVAPRRVSRLRGCGRTCVCPPFVTVGSVAAYWRWRWCWHRCWRWGRGSGPSSHQPTSRSHQPFGVKLPGEFGCAQVTALHRPAALLEPQARLLLPFIVFALLCSSCCFVLYHLTFTCATSLSWA